MSGTTVGRLCRGTRRAVVLWIAVATVLTVFGPLRPARAEVFGGVDFPQGVSSFADEVVSYNPILVAGTPLPRFRHPWEALGAPDNGSPPPICTTLEPCAVSLGKGGTIVLRFVDNVLTGSGSDAKDLYIFEVGPDVEDTFVEVSVDGTIWKPVGKVTGSTRGIDIDLYGYHENDRFSYVRLRDDPHEGEQAGNSVGADIDAVGAITSKPPEVSTTTSSTSTTTTTTAPPLPQISVGDVAVAEGDSGTAVLSFPVRRTGDLSEASSFSYATSDGTARAASGDYVPEKPPIQVTLAPGQGSAVIPVVVNGDLIAEPHETLVVTLTGPIHAVLVDTSATGTITNDDGPGASLAVADVTVLEGDSGSSDGFFTVTRSGETAEISVVGATVADKTALAGSDYSAPPETVAVTFGPGETTRTVPFTILGDVDDEPNETFVVTLSKPVNATISDKAGVATIVDDDAGPAVFPPGTYLAVDDVAVLEGDAGTTNLVFMVSRTGDTSGTTTVQVSTADGTALSSSDYTAVAPTTLTFGPGDTTQLVTVAAHGDTVGEAHETLLVRLSGAEGAVVSDSAGTGTITNDDGDNAQLAVSDVSVGEGDLGTTAVVGFEITRAGDASESADVTVSTADTTALAGSDYEALGPVVATMAPGVTSLTVLVTVNGDDVEEGNEAFRLHLTEPVRASIVDDTGVATIVDDDVDAG